MVAVCAFLKGPLSNVVVFQSTPCTLAERRRLSPSQLLLRLQNFRTQVPHGEELHPEAPVRRGNGDAWARWTLESDKMAPITAHPLLNPRLSWARCPCPEVTWHDFSSGRSWGLPWLCQTGLSLQSQDKLCCMGRHVVNTLCLLGRCWESPHPALPSGEDCRASSTADLCDRIGKNIRAK